MFRGITLILAKLTCAKKHQYCPEEDPAAQSVAQVLAVMSTKLGRQNTRNKEK